MGYLLTRPINTIHYRVHNNRFIIGVVIATNIHVYIAHIYSGEGDKCTALVTRNNKIKLLKYKIMINLLL